MIYRKFSSFIVGHGFKRTAVDQCVYVQKFLDGNFVMLLLYVDDMLVIGQYANMIRKLKEELSKSFDMKDLGPTQQSLGIKIVRDKRAKKIWLSHEKYIEWVLKTFNMRDAKPVTITLTSYF